MKGLAFGLSLLLVASLASAEETLLEVSWQALKRQGRLTVGDVSQGGGDGPGEFLRLVNATGQPATLHLATLERPAISQALYAVTGKVRHDGVQGRAYLEMWSVFPNGAQYFSRTLATSGPLRSLEGSSPWRSCLLPFRNEPGAPPPQKLVLNLVLPGGGTVELGPLRLVQYLPDEDPLARAGAWWSDRAAGLAGGICGSLVGCLGGLIGLLVSRGQARTFVVASLKAMAGLGLLAFGAGVVAVTRQQPYAVYYPLLLCGVIAGAIPFWGLPIARRRYENAELRRLRARDA